MDTWPVINTLLFNLSLTVYTDDGGEHERWLKNAPESSEVLLGATYQEFVKFLEVKALGVGKSLPKLVLLDS